MKIKLSAGVSLVIENEKLSEIGGPKEHYDVSLGSDGKLRFNGHCLVDLINESVKRDEAAFRSGKRV